MGSFKWDGDGPGKELSPRSDHNFVRARLHLSPLHCQKLVFIVPFQPLNGWHFLEAKDEG
jgi:hypothetical protein